MTARLGETMPLYFFRKFLIPFSIVIFLSHFAHAGRYDSNQDLGTVQVNAGEPGGYSSVVSGNSPAYSYTTVSTSYKGASEISVDFSYCPVGGYFGFGGCSYDVHWCSDRVGIFTGQIILTYHMVYVGSDPNYHLDEDETTTLTLHINVVPNSDKPWANKNIAGRFG